MSAAKKLALAVEQLSLFDEPGAHLDMLHSKQLANAKPGTIIAWTPKQENKKWHTFAPSLAQEYIPRFLEQVDVYITPNLFYGWRTIKNLHTLQSFYVDIDCHDIDFNNDDDILRMPRLVEETLDKIERAGIPDPNCIVYSGRGLHVYWLIEPTHPNALPRWQSCQRRLVEICGADRQSADATRVLRLVGSINSKTNIKVRAEQRHNNIYKFDWLHDQIQPVARQELAEIRDIRALRAAKGLKPVRKTVQGSIYQRWYLVYQDLLIIIEYQIQQNEKGHGLAAGMRDLLLFHLANALSWFTVSDALEHEVADCARRFTPTLTLTEAMSYCSSVIERARKTQLTGQEHRYKYKRETLYDQLQDLISDEIQPQLRAIIPNELATERDRQRKQDARRANGVVERAAYEAQLKAQAINNQDEAYKLKEKGLKQKEIAAELGISIDTVKSYFRKKKVY